MATRIRTLLAASLVALPCLAYTCPAFGHNGRDRAPPPLKEWAQAKAMAKHAAPPGGTFIDIYQGIVVKVDPKTGVRSYVQVGDVAANPARARVSASTGGPGMDYWVDKEFERNQYPAPAEPSYAYNEPATQMSSYDEGYYPYGGYLPVYGYGGGFDRPGDGHGGGRPGHGGGGGGNNPPPRDGNGGINPDPRPCCRQPGPRGGGVGSPPPYNDPGVGSPPPAVGYGGFRSRRG